MPTNRRLPAPGRSEELDDACFIVKDSAGQKLGYFYFEEEAGRPSSAKRNRSRSFSEIVIHAPSGFAGCAF
jgi:hypothetical protein